MALPDSPSHFNYTNGYEEDPIFQKSHYTQDISEQMRVPKRIRATGEVYEDFDNMNGWNPYQHDKIDMTVPDRIMVMGQDQHFGSRAAPREIVLDNSILPKDTDHIRVGTPPRTISLADHHFPSAADEAELTPDIGSHHDFDQSSVGSLDEKRSMSLVRPKKLYQQDLFNTSREATPPFGDHYSPSEEVVLLRRQVAKLNRRVLSIEFESIQRQQRDKVIYCVGLAYFLIKAIMWLNRN